MLIRMVSSDKHSSFSSTFPIYLFTQKTEEVPIEEDELPNESETVSEPEKEDPTTELDDDEVLIEDVLTEETKKPEEPVVPKTKTVTVDEWVHANPQPPIWTRYVLQFNFWMPL
jgi:heat shock protein beta